MPRAFALATLVLAATLGPTAGCGLLEPGAHEDLLTFHIAPHRAECTGVAAQRCLLVRQGSELTWTYFYDVIEGFTYEEGYNYKLRVARRKVKDPPADGSAYRYRLVAVLEKVPAPSR